MNKFDRYVPRRRRLGNLSSQVYFTDQHWIVELRWPHLCHNKHFNKKDNLSKLTALLLNRTLLFRPAISSASQEAKTLIRGSGKSAYFHCLQIIHNKMDWFRHRTLASRYRENFNRILTFFAHLQENPFKVVSIHLWRLSKWYGSGLTATRNAGLTNDTPTDFHADVTRLCLAVLTVGRANSSISPDQPRGDKQLHVICFVCFCFMFVCLFHTWNITVCHLL